VTATDRVIRWTTAGALIGVAAVAAVASYEPPMISCEPMVRRAGALLCRAEGGFLHAKSDAANGNTGLRSML